MSQFKTIKVAAIQATPVILDAAKCMEKAAALIEEAAGAGARLAVLPETFVPLYPSNAWARAAADFDGFDDLWEKLWANSLDVPGPEIDMLAALCAKHDIHVVIGVNERESQRPGSLYNTSVLVGPDGFIMKHRKTMPTMHERLFHGVGSGDDLTVAETAIGKIGGLICWENRMPLARYSLYREGPQFWVAPTADDTDGWLATVRHIAIESGAFVISVPQYIPRSAFPADFPVPVPKGEKPFGRGGAAIIEPTWGEVIAGPLYDKEGIIYAECDLKLGLRAKRWFDSVGHYSREDIFLAKDDAEEEIAEAESGDDE